jgi:hypothetical protein
MADKKKKAPARKQPPAPKHRPPAKNPAAIALVNRARRGCS